MPCQAFLYGVNEQTKSFFYPFSGVTEELKTFIHDISQASLKVIKMLICMFSTNICMMLFAFFGVNVLGLLGIELVFY